MKKIFLLICIILLAAPDAFSQSTLIKKIEVRGAELIKETEVMDVVSTRPGDDFSSSRLREDLRSIYKIGCFTDASIEVEDFEGGLKVIFALKEKPGIGEIKFKGRKSVWESTLKDALDIKKGDTCSCDEIKLKQNERKILDAYEERGFPYAAVTHEIELVKGAANITFTVSEGRRVKVDELNFYGNKAYTSKFLAGKIQVRQGKWFSQKKLDDDIDKLADFYRDEGYILVGIDPPSAGFRPAAQAAAGKEKEKFVIEVRIAEGTRIKVESLQIKGNTIFTEKEIRGRLSTKEKAVFNQSRFIEDMKNLQNMYAERGYILCKIVPLTDIQEDSGIISVIVDIQEENLVYIEKVKIEGNIITKDKVIRRELTVREGEVFNTQKVIRSRQKIYNLGFFDEVDITTEPGNEKGKMFLVVTVKEKRTGMMSFGAGYNSLDGLLGYLEYSQNNLFGLGQFFSVKWEFGAQKQNIETSYTDPWFLDTPTSVGIDLYHTIRDITSYYYTEKKDRRRYQGRQAHNGL